MTDTKDRSAPRWLPLLAAVVFGIVGYQVGKYLAVKGLSGVPAFAAAHIFALGTATIYMFVGLFICAAAAFPILRKLSWTEADAEDIAINPKLYVLQGASAALWGLSLLVLALGGVDLPLDPVAAGVAALAIFGGGLALYWRSLVLMDELYRATTLESAGYTYGLILAVAGIWAAMAHLDLARPPAMLTIVTLFWALALAGSIIAAARRGMLKDEAG